MPEWSPAREWWMDLLRSGVVFTLGALITLFLLNRLEDRRAADRFVSEAAFQLRVRALDDFRRCTLAYMRAAIAAYTDLHQWVLVADRDKTAAMNRYEQGAYEDYLTVVETVRARFADVQQLPSYLDGLEAASKKRHGLYDAIVDAKLDGKTGIASRPKADRTAFDEGISEMQSIREAILPLLESAAEQRIPRRRAA